MTDDLQDMMRVALDKHAEELGVPDPGNLPNKQAVIDAIHATERNPAFAPVSAERKPTVYKVIGPHRVQGTDPGKTFVHLYTPEQEAALIEGGHITREKEKVA